MKKRVKKQKSILQNQDNKQCYLCMLQESNYAYQIVEDHHIYFGPNRRNSEIHGFKVNLCIWHHRDGNKVYTTDVVVEEQEFAESKNAQNHAAGQAAAGKPQVDPDGFMNIPDGIDEELPFS